MAQFFFLLLGIVLRERCLPANFKEKNQLSTLLINDRLFKAKTNFVLEMAKFGKEQLFLHSHEVF